MTQTRRLLTAVALLLLPLLSASAGDDAEEKAVQAIKKLGGSIVRDEKVPGKPIIEVQIEVQRTDHWTDEDLKPLAELKELQKLGLGFNEVTDKTPFLTNRALNGSPGDVKNRSFLIPGSRRTKRQIVLVHAAPHPDDCVANSEIR